jgi:hypothetical protein
MKKYFVGIYGVGKENELDENKHWFNSYDLALAANKILNNLNKNDNYQVSRPIDLIADDYKIEIFDNVQEQIGFSKKYANILNKKNFFIKEKIREKTTLDKFKNFSQIVIPAHYKVTSHDEFSKIIVGRYFDKIVAQEHADKINDACNCEWANIEKVQKMRLNVFNSLKDWEETYKNFNLCY